MAWPTTSRHARGYGKDHERIRKDLLRDEPLCRKCTKHGRISAATIADHIVPRSQGGQNVQSNYQPLCKPCSDAKTAREAGHRPRPTIGLDGWPV